MRESHLGGGSQQKPTTWRIIVRLNGRALFRSNPRGHCRRDAGLDLLAQGKIRLAEAGHHLFWDAQKDIAAALYGALLCVTILAAVRAVRGALSPSQAPPVVIDSST